MKEISSSRKVCRMALFLILFGAVLALLMWAIPWVLSGLHFLVWLVALTLITILAVAILFYLLSSLRSKWCRTASPLTPTELPECGSPGSASYLAKYAERALGAYANQPHGVFRYVDRFWFEGGVFGWVEDNDNGELYVTFRGTSELGNWFLTNAQAHMVEAGEVFDSRDVKGGVHQGFVKAYRDLWYDCSTAKPASEAASKARQRGAAGNSTDIWTAANRYKLKKWLLAPLWAIVLAVPMYLALYLARESDLAMFGPPSGLSERGYLYLILLAGVLVLAAQLLFAFGLFERFFQRGTRLFLGPPLSEVVVDKAKNKKKIVFIGHSLGGALATLAFVDYYLTHAPGDKVIELVTFGAPQVGNDTFGKWLGALRKKHKVYIVGGIGDPVPHLPPRHSFLKVASDNPTCFGAVLAAVYLIGWCPYAWCYRALLASEWDSLVLWLDSPEPGLEISNHSFTYTNLKSTEKNEAT